MLLGSILPFIFPGIYEIWAISNKAVSKDYQAYKMQQTMKKKEIISTDENDTGQNEYGLKVLLIAMSVVGIIILVLGSLASEARILVMSMGAFVLLVPLVSFWARIVGRMKKIEA